MKHFLKTTGLAAGLVMGGTMVASAAMVDLTDLRSYTQSPESATGMANGVSWTLTPSAPGTLTYNDGPDAPGANNGLNGQGDGVGIRGLGDDDEVDNDSDNPGVFEYLTLTFSREVTVTDLFYLDLFQDPEDRTREQATFYAGAVPMDGSELVSTDAMVNAIMGTGFATANGSFTGTTFSFAPTGDNDALSLDNFALAGFSYEVDDAPAPIPVPAAGLLLVGALGGLGLARRRR